MQRASAAGRGKSWARNYAVEVIACASQIGSGALPAETLPSAGLAIRSISPRASGRVLNALAAALRALPVPVIGRIEKQALVLDLRCLEDERAFLASLAKIKIPDASA